MSEGSISFPPQRAGEGWGEGRQTDTRSATPHLYNWLTSRGAWVIRPREQE
jgi:hypothetical protein